MTFPTGVETRKYSNEELTAMLDEAREASKHAHKLDRVMGIVAAHRIKQMREFLMYEELAIWRKDNGFDRVAEDEESCFHCHRSLPPTPQEYYAGLRSEVNALKDAITMARQKVRNLINAIEQDKLSDEEFANLRRFVEKRVREAAQMTVTRVDTVQYCSPISEPLSDAYVKLENNEGKMGQELEELKSSSAGTGIETPEQQCSPTEGIWETGKTTTSGILTAGAGPSRGENILSPAERVTRTVMVAGISSIAATPSKRRHKTFSEENKQFDPGGQGENARLETRLCSTFFSGESWQAPCCFLFVPCALCFVCVCFPQNIFFLLQVILLRKLKAMRRDQVSRR